MACDKDHFLAAEPARVAAESLLAKLAGSASIVAGDDDFAIDYLWGKALGKMFGVLVGLDNAGQEVSLQAFSGQYNGHWLAPGWVPPLFSVPDFDALVAEVDPIIKGLGREIAHLSSDDSQYKSLLIKRKKLSQNHMKNIHRLYQLFNFNGSQKNLAAAYLGSNGIPNGAGDCCGPKLLNYAARNGIKPLGLAEFYFGAANKAGTKLHKHFYSACKNKCQPILGFQLCGFDG